MVSPKAARVYRAKIPNCNVSLVYDAGHLIEVDRPEALINLASHFVERRETLMVSRGSSIRSGQIRPLPGIDTPGIAAYINLRQ